MLNQEFIYGLHDPETGELRYVGKAKNLEHRLSRHLSSEEKCHRGCWIRSLKSRGFAPVLSVLDSTIASEALPLEAAYIEFYRESGFDLVNNTPGGEGGPVMRGADHPNFGKPLPLEVCIKIAAGHCGKKQGPHTQEHRDKISAALSGKPKSAEHAAKVGAAHKGRPKSPEAVAKMRASLTGVTKGRPWSEARREAYRRTL